MVSLSTLLLAAVATFASAHVSCNPPTAPANGYFTTIVRVPHSYPNATTTNVTVQLAPNVTSVKPQLVAGWKVDLTYAAADATKLEAITWYGGELPDALYGDFGLQMKLPNAPVGTVFYFPVTQATSNGTIAWTSIPDANGNLSDPAHPAPKVTIVNATTTSPGAAPAPVAKSGVTHTTASTLVVATAAALIWA
ncbi:hypothetical protein ACHHYP_02736 [Achlya hypogyna]|uniref:Secreted protein n=1 Tax=Achlya hypogyna TaxID=1202772 RepID=A0A0A7CMY4_ACHHY|nr:secreted protein [Achlya hypogyna]OQR93284.1 hypothetical protein ACHHYP_02736 [Achlya hypogyna]